MVGSRGWWVGAGTSVRVLQLLAILTFLSTVGRIRAIDPITQGGVNLNWKPNPNPMDITQVMGWRDLQGFRILKADDSHFGDR